MSFSTHTTSSGFILPSIHAAPPFFTEQPNPTTSSIAAEQWIRLIQSFARHHRLFFLKVEDAEAPGSDWDEILRNPRINRKIMPSYLGNIISAMVVQNVAVYEPAKQNRAVLLHWRQPEDWADILYNWASSTGQLNTILTFYDITDPPIVSDLSNIPVVLLKRAINILSKAGKAQLIAIPDGEGVRFLAGR